MKREMSHYNLPFTYNFTKLLQVQIFLFLQKQRFQLSALSNSLFGLEIYIRCDDIPKVYVH